MLKRGYLLLLMIISISLLTSCDDTYTFKSQVKLETLSASMSLYEDDLTESINLSQFIITNIPDKELVVTIINLPQHGNVELRKHQDEGYVAIYSPDVNFYGFDSFDFQVSNGKLTSISSVYIRVKAKNDDPIASDIKLTVYENSSLTINLTEYVIDIDSEQMIYTIEMLPEQGYVSLSENYLTYTPSEGFLGDVTMRYLVKDDQGGVNSGTITIKVVPKPASLSN